MAITTTTTMPTNSTTHTVEPEISANINLSCTADPIMAPTITTVIPSNKFKHTVEPSESPNIHLYRDPTLRFSTIRIVVHANSDMKEGWSGNHVSLYLLLDDNRSVGVNMTAPFGTIQGALHWSSYEYQVPRSSIVYWDVPVKGPLEGRRSVGELYELMVQKGLHRYSFVRNKGCRFWIHHVLKILDEAAWIDKSWPPKLWNLLSFQYTTTPGLEPRRIFITEGDFDSDRWSQKTFAAIQAKEGTNYYMNFL